MYRYIREGKIPLHREPEYQGLYKRDSKELYDIGFELNEVIADMDIVRYGSANIQEEIEKMVRKYVEEKVDTYITTITDDNLTEKQKESIKEDAWEFAKDKYVAAVSAAPLILADLELMKKAWYTYLDRNN